MKKKLFIASIGTVLTIAAISTAVAVNSPAKVAGAEDSPIVKTLSDHSKELANHEARITNTEANVNAVADKTGTNTTTVVQVPTANPNPSMEPTATPITVVSYETILVNELGSTDCKLTYSDGSDYQWHWKVVNPHGAWVTDGNGQNGHWQSTIQTSGTCDASVVGQTKSS